MNLIRCTRPLLVAVLLGSATGYAQAAPQGQLVRPPEQPATTRVSTGAPAPLVILFKSGSRALRAKDNAVLDRASRAYNEGKPIVMILTGTSDRVGNPERNLTLSQQRAIAVLTGLLDRGIPADRFQILAKGETELPVPTGRGVADAQNRRVEISWH